MEQLQNVVISHGRLTAKRPNGGDVAVPIQPAVLTAAGLNAVAPGVVRTKLAEALWKDHENQLNSATALGRIGEPGDVGSAVAFLVSDASSWVTGETFVIDGGQRLGNARPFRQGTGVHE